MKTRALATIVPLLLMLTPLVASCSHAEPAATDPLANPTGAPMRAAYQGYTVVWLQGTPYQMGYQHGQLLHDELAQGVIELEDDPVLATMAALAQVDGLIELAQSNSYPDFIEECQGMVDAASDVGWTMADCLVLNFGDALAEFINASFTNVQPGCTQVVAKGSATTDGRLLHGRIMDWDNISFVVDNPTLFVRQPTGGIPHVIIGFPGNISPYQGMNADGITVGTNQITAASVSKSREGRSAVQLAGEVLAHAGSLLEAHDMVMLTQHLTHLTMVVSDASAGAGEVYEITPTVVGVRPLDADVVYATNHFLSPTTKGLDVQPPAEHSILRYERLGQLVPPAGTQTMYGKLDVDALVSIERDRVDPETGAVSPASMFDDGLSLATDGALFEVVFDPTDLRFWVAAGAIPIPQQPFVGFSLGKLIGRADAVEPDPATIQ